MVAGDEEPHAAGRRRFRRPSWLMIAYGVGLLVVLGLVGMLALSGLKAGAGGKKDKGGPGIHGRKNGGGGAKKPRRGKKGRRGSLPAPSGLQYALLLEANPAGALDEPGEALAEPRNDDARQVAAEAGHSGHELEPGGPQAGDDREPDVCPGLVEGLPALRAPPA
jgi:hypothetical protein